MHTIYENEKLIEELNDLLLINNDRINQYKNAIENSKNSEFVPLYKKMIKQSLQYNEELLDEIKRKTQNQNLKRTLKHGSIYRLWCKLISSLNNDKKSIFETYEIIELAAQKAYQKALSPDVYIPSDITSLLFMHKAKLKESYQALKDKQNLDLVNI